MRSKILWRVTVVQYLNLSQLLTNGHMMNTHPIELCQEKLAREKQFFYKLFLPILFY